jgi:hypothetical protein
MSAPPTASPVPSNSTGAGQIVHGGLSLLAGPSRHSPGTSPKGAMMMVNEEIVNSIVSKSTGTLETKIRDLQVELTTKFHDEINAQMNALNESFSDFIQTEVSTAVSD